MEKLTFITLGEAAVGKTTFVVSATEERACTKIHPTTLGCIPFIKRISYCGKNYTIELRDTVGSERYRSVARQYIRGCDGAFLMFDKDHSSMVDLEYWRKFYEDNADDPEWVLVKTKSDSKSEKERNMDCRLHVLFSKLHEKPFFEVSAHEYKGVEEALDALITRVLHKRRMESKQAITNTKPVMDLNRRDATRITIVKQENKKGGCC